jgi:UDP-N-acetylmuramoylalanine--D-glutamate ligase
VAELDKIAFVNDSKATNVDSTIWALKNISRPIVLISGGRDKGSDYSIILDLVQKKVKEIILIGEAKKKIENAFKGFLPINEAGTLEEAVLMAFSKANSGDCVLLSPMCSSFDMFSNYEERGRVFKNVVSDLVKSKR